MKYVFFLFCLISPIRYAFAEDPAPIQKIAPAAALKPQLIDFKKVYTSSPMIYTLLAMMSVGSMALWLYTLATFRPKEIMPESFLKELRILLGSERYDSAKEFCAKKPNLLSALISAGLVTRNLGASVMIDSMKSEGKRVSTPFWQRLSLLNDVAIVAPMIGLLGTVIGMFYAFYDVNRSVESISALFDGLGISVGTTVVGLIVAILAMIFATTLKYRLVKTLSHVENEALALSTLIQTKR
jgi:biopolymer transport protein ExbB